VHKSIEIQLPKSL